MDVAPENTTLPAVTAWLWVALGVALSVLIPFLFAAVRRFFPAGGATTTDTRRLWDVAAPYLLLGVASLAVGVLVIAFIDFKDWRAAVIGGYAWDSTLQKLRAV